VKMRRLTRLEGCTRRRTGCDVNRMAAVILLCSWLAASTVRAAEGTSLEPPAASPAASAGPTPAAVAPPTEPARPLAGQPAPTPPNPALDLSTPTPAPAQPSLLHRWWFWTAVGAAAAATVAIIVISSRGHAPPTTDLGNQEFQP
jgi:hypothetical protein